MLNNSNQLKIIFMGTPEFSIPTLEKLLDTNNIIEAVYTRKPAESGRGKKIQNTPVHDFAVKHGLQVFTPSTFKKGKNLEKIREIKPDLIVVVAYGLILPRELLEIPKFGCINLHPSLLPKYRGCAPIETGVCVMKIAEGLDNGDIIATTKIKINKDTDIKFLKDTLSKIGADMIVDVVNKISNNEKLEYIKQNDNLATFTDKITDEDGKIDWTTDDVVTIHKKIRALNESVGIYMFHNNNRIKILKSDYILNDGINFGEIVDKYFSIQCNGGILKPLILQKEGKKAMDVKSFINGYRFNIGDKISNNK